MLYQSLIFQHCLYGSCHIDAGSMKATNRLDISQKKVLKAVFGVDARFPTKLFHKRTEVTFFNDIRHQQVCILAYEGLHDLSDPAINNMFEKQIGKPGRKSADTVEQPLVRFVFGSGSFGALTHADSYWMLLLNETRQSPSLNMFLRSVSNHYS